MKVIIICLLLVVVTGCLREETRLVGKGVYDHTEYLKGGAFDFDHTVIHLDGGSTIVLRRLHDINKTKGEYIEVWVTHDEMALVMDYTIK